MLCDVGKEGHSTLLEADTRQEKPTQFASSRLYSGDAGNRTPVRREDHQNVYVNSQSLSDVPLPGLTRYTVPYPLVHSPQSHGHTLKLAQHSDIRLQPVRRNCKEWVT
jgi:hypothetical protein